jgi:hypothetical protein
MYIDKELLFSDAQAITVDAASTNVIDLGVAGRNIAANLNLVVAIQVDVAADFTTTDETYTFNVRNSAAAALTSPTDMASRTVTAANLTAGTIIYIPVGSPVALRYLGVYYDVGGTTPSITVTAWLTTANAIDNSRAYADAL